MHPILFQLFGHPVYSFGVMLALGMLFGVALAVFRTHRRWGKASAEAVLTLLPWLLVASLLGARLFYAVYYPALWASPLALLAQNGGMVWYGGVLGGLIAAAVWQRWGQASLPPEARLSLLALADALLPALLLGLAFGRVGCLLAGCCYGAVCDAHLPWAMHYPHAHATAGLAVHPVPIYESLGALGLLGGIVWLERGKSVANTLGLATGVSCVGYGLLRFINEALRGDKLMVGDALSASQWMSVGVIVLGAIVLWRQARLVRSSKA